jgi:hypothetical protein
MPLIPDEVSGAVLSAFLSDVGATLTELSQGHWRMDVDGSEVLIRHADESDASRTNGVWLYKVYRDAENRGRNGLHAAAMDLVARYHEDDVIPDPPTPADRFRVYPCFEVDPDLPPDDDPSDLFAPWHEPLRIVWGILADDHLLAWLQDWTLEEMDVDAATLARCAMLNLGKYVPNVVPFELAGGEQRYPSTRSRRGDAPAAVAFWGGAQPMLNAACVLVPGHMEILHHQLGTTDLLVALPSPTMAVACATSPEGFESLRLVAHVLHAGALKSLTPSLYRCRDGEWQTVWSTPTEQR